MMTYVKALTERKEKCQVSQQWGSEEIEDNCIKDKHTLPYHMRCVCEKCEKPSSSSMQTDNLFFFLSNVICAYGPMNKNWYISSMKSSVGLVILVAVSDTRPLKQWSLIGCHHRHRTFARTNQIQPCKSCEPTAAYMLWFKFLNDLINLPKSGLLRKLRPLKIKT